MTSNNPQQIFKNRLIVTGILSFIFLSGIVIPLPCIDHQAIKNEFNENTPYLTINAFSGNSLSQLGLFALNIFPSLNASIVLQFLIPVFPYLEKLQQEEGAYGERELTKIRKYITLAVSFIQAFGLTSAYNRYITNQSIVIILLVAGSMSVLWISDLLTERGIASGPSLILLINILRNPQVFLGLKEKVFILSLFDLSINIGAFFLVSYLINVLLAAKVEVPIITSKQLLASNSSKFKNNLTIPLKLNQGGILPVALASTAMIVPITIFGKSRILLALLPFVSNALIIILNYFYTLFLWNPKKIAEDLKKVSSAVPGVRPGFKTEKYLEKFVTRYSIVGGIFLCFISLIPGIVRILFHPSYFIFDNINITSLIILFGVNSEISNNIRSLLVAYRYIPTEEKIN